MTLPTVLDDFLSLSASLTGFERSTLLATGLLDTYYHFVRQQLGEVGLHSLLSREGTTDSTASQRLIRLWYTGLWEDTLVHPEAYREGLFWRAVGANPPGSRPPGYGTWALEPPLRSELARGLTSLILILILLFAGWVETAQAAASADLLKLEQSNSCNRCDLSAADLAHRDLYGAAINGADLSGADLSGSLMSDARLAVAHLEGVYLTGADLSNAVLSGADLRNGKLTNAILRGGNLKEARLEGADLSSADLRQAQLAGARLAAANLAGAQLRDADLSGADLRNADLRHADLRGAHLDGAQLCGADLLQALMPDGLRSGGDSPRIQAC
jgi:uncharacterized protein YjbI with pentapeptide repeats